MPTSVKKKRSHYMIPHRAGVVPFHVWKSLVEKAGYKTSDIPKTWDAFLDFFKLMQAKLRHQGVRNIYAYSFQIGAVGFDSIFTFNHFNIAYRGQHIVTPDGKMARRRPENPRGRDQGSGEVVP